MTKFLLILLFLTAMLHLGYPLKCWKCNGCENSKYLKETCRTVDPNEEVASCLTQVVRVSGATEPMTVKKCEYTNKNVQYQCKDLPETSPVSCNICTGDFCNAAPSPVSSCYIIVGVLAFTFIPKMLT